MSATSSLHRRYPRRMARNASGAGTRMFLLMGSGEFEPWSDEIEAAALDGRTGPVVVLPTASSTEGEDVFGGWGRMALEHYATAGIDARLVPVKTREDAEEEGYARALEGASMVFFSARWCSSPEASRSTWPRRSTGRGCGTRSRTCST